MAAPSTKPMLESGGGFLDPETGMWVEEGSSRRSSRAASPSPSPEKKSYHQGKKVKRKAGKRKSAADKKQEWDLAQQMWGSLGDSTTPQKKEKKKETRFSEEKFCC